MPKINRGAGLAQSGSPIYNICQGIQMRLILGIVPQR